MDKLKKILSRIVYYPFLPDHVTNVNQTIIRQVEWESVREYIPVNSSFLDVGCGSGYAMLKAKADRGCKVKGIDPEPGSQGVNRGAPINDALEIKMADAEQIPFADGVFDVVYCSHVLEHVNNTNQALKEMERVLDKEGVLIIGMPTAAMAWVNFITELMFNSHIRLAQWLFPGWIKARKTSFRQFILPPSHSHAGRSVFFDMRYYKVKNWKRMISKVFIVEAIERPLMYPYPETRQFFRPFTSRWLSSSVFFICRKVNRGQ